MPITSDEAVHVWIGAPHVHTDPESRSVALLGPRGAAQPPATDVAVHGQLFDSFGDFERKLARPMGQKRQMVAPRACGMPRSQPTFLVI